MKVKNLEGIYMTDNINDILDFLDGYNTLSDIVIIKSRVDQLYAQKTNDVTLLDFKTKKLKYQKDLEYKSLIDSERIIKTVNAGLHYNDILALFKGEMETSFIVKIYNANIPADDMRNRKKVNMDGQTI